MRVAQDELSEDLQMSICNALFELRHKVLMGIAVTSGTE